MDELYEQYRQVLANEPVTVEKFAYQLAFNLIPQGMTVVLVEQDTKRAIKTGEISHVMLKGKVVLSGRSAELGEEEIKKAYFGL